MFANNLLMIYFTARTHYGHVVEAVRMLYNGQSVNRVVYTEDSLSTNKNNAKIVLHILRYLYACHLNTFHIQLKSNLSSLIRVLNQLNRWENQGWPLADKTSHELYLDSRKAGQRYISLNKIPKNYVGSIATYREILKGINHFKYNISFTRCYRSDNNLMILNTFAWNQLKGLPPTKEAEQKYQKSRLTRLSSQKQDPIAKVLMNPKLQMRFKAICTSRAKSSTEILKELILKYIQNDDSSSNKYDWHKDLERRIDRSIKNAVDWTDLIHRLHQYGVDVKLFNKDYINRHIGHPFLNDIQYAFINKRGKYVEARGKNLNKHYTIPALAKKILKNTEKQTA